MIKTTTEWGDVFASALAASAVVVLVSESTAGSECSSSGWTLGPAGWEHDDWEHPISDDNDDADHRRFCRTVRALLDNHDASSYSVRVAPPTTRSTS